MPPWQVSSYYLFGTCAGFPGNAIQTPTQQSTASGSLQAAPFTPSPSLAPSTLYCYQLCTNTTSSGLQCAGSQSFTSGPAPQVYANPATNVDSPLNSSTLNGAVVYPPGTPYQW